MDMCVAVNITLTRGIQPHGGFDTIQYKKRGKKLTHAHTLLI